MCCCVFYCSFKKEYVYINFLICVKSLKIYNFYIYVKYCFNKIGRTKFRSISNINFWRIYLLYYFGLLGFLFYFC